MRLSERSEWEHRYRSAWRRGELLWACVETIRKRRRANPDLSLEEIADQLEADARQQIGEAERIAEEVLRPAASEPDRWTAEELEALQFTASRRRPGGMMSATCTPGWKASPEQPRSR